MIWMIFLFMSDASSPRPTMTLRRADDSGSNKPSRMNMRQKSFFVVGLCRSKTLQMPLSAWTTRSDCSL